jgi:glucose-1-phosphate adenylyltransferase
MADHRSNSPTTATDSGTSVRREPTSGGWRSTFRPVYCARIERAFPGWRVVVADMALVLSGGGGERLSVLSSERAVSAVPFGGKYRIVDFVLSNCSHSGIEHVALVTQHVPISLHDHVGAGRPWDYDRRTGGILILQPYQTRTQHGWYRGTADAIAQNWDSIEERRPDRVIVLSGDHVYRMNYRALLQTHADRRAAMTMAVTRVPVEQSRRFGMVTLDRDGRLLTLVEKPERSQTPYASMGIYVFEYEQLGELLRPRPVDLVLDVVRPLIESGERVYAHEFSGYWEDVGTVPSYYRANLDLVAPEPRFSLYDPRWPILTRDEERPPVLLDARGRVEDALVANGCRIRGTVRRSVLFPGVVVEPGAVVTDSIVLSDATIAADASVDRAILDKYVRIGAGARVGEGTPDGAADVWLEGLTVVGKDATIPAGARVGRAAVIGIGAREEDFPLAEVRSGTQTPNRPWFRDRVAAS